MSSNELLAMIRKRPFEPFQIRLSDGTTNDIHHPELVMPGLSRAVVGVPADPTQPFISESHAILLRHIVKTVPLGNPVTE